MKKLFFAIFCLCSFATFAQSNYVAGSITLNDGNVISGQIDYRDWITTPRQIRFRLSTDSAPLVYNCKDLKAFTITSRNEIYQSVVADINNESVDIDNLKTYYVGDKFDYSLDLDRDTVFLLVLAQGRLNLFMLHDNKEKIHYFIQKEGGNVEELIYRRLKVLVPAQGGWGNSVYIPEIREVNDYKKQLNIATKEYAALQPKIQKSMYGNAILDIVKAYNLYVGQMTYLRPKNKAPHSFYAFAGGATSFVAVKDYYQLKSLSLTTPITYVAGIGVDIGLKKTNNKMSISVEANYMETQIEFYSKADQLDGAFKNLEYRIDLKALRCNALAKYVVYQGRVQPYVKAGVGISTYLDPTYTRTLSGGSSAPTITHRNLNKSEVFATGILGLRYGRLFVEGRFDRGTDINKTDKENLKMDRLSFVAGYTYQF